MRRTTKRDFSAGSKDWQNTCSTLRVRRTTQGDFSAGSKDWQNTCSTVRMRRTTKWDFSAGSKDWQNTCSTVRMRRTTKWDFSAGNKDWQNTCSTVRLRRTTKGDFLAGSKDWQNTGSSAPRTATMTRLRRKALVALFLFTLFIFGTMMGLRTLKPSDGFSDLAPGMDLTGGRSERRRPDVRDVLASPGQPPHMDASYTKVVFTKSDRDFSIFYDVHIFYYLWYGSPSVDNKYIHWDHVLVPHWDPKIAASHAQGRHTPPEDIASSFYPELGPYSSRDPKVLESHMAQIEAAGAGVLVLSWYPPGVADDHGEPSEDLVPAVMDAAHKHSIKVAFHIQPYRGRTDQNVHDNIKYIIDKYGKHGAFYRFKTSTGQVLPLFYIYDSYLTPPESWAELLTPKGSQSIRGTPYDGVFVALIVEERHKHDILASGFDGIYTYFASNGFSFGSSHQNWKAIKAFCDASNLLFIPSVGPGYIDTAVRPWNNHNTRNRVNGRYYETALQAALSVRPDIVTITSFNQWHEGTQIERAVPKKTVTRLYLDYQPNQPDHFLDLTHQWAESFHREKDKWLM